MNRKNDQIARIVAALQSATAPLSTAALRAVSGATPREVYHRIREAKADFAACGKQVCNLRGVGYWLAREEGSKLDEAAKSYRRGIGHLQRGNDIMDRVDRSQLTTAADMEIYGINVAMRAMTRAMFAGNAATIEALARAQQTADRLLQASREAEAPDPDKDPS